MTALINRKTHHIGGVEFRNPRKFQLLAVTVANSAVEAGSQPMNRYGHWLMHMITRSLN